MKNFNNYIGEIEKLFNSLKNTQVDIEVDKAVKIINFSLQNKHALLICGNGGSASDAMHITGELIGRFLIERKPLNVICLSANLPVITAWANDYEYETIFSRQVEAHGTEGGVLLCLTTSGNSKNIIKAVEAAKNKGMTSICMTGKGGGAVSKLCDLLIEVPSNSTPRIQEMHVAIYHYMCERIEKMI